LPKAKSAFGEVSKKTLKSIFMKLKKSTNIMKYKIKGWNQTPISGKTTAMNVEPNMTINSIKSFKLMIQHLAVEEPLFL
jgi:hypothetical protein